MVGTGARWARAEIERLDPDADAERIVHLTTHVRFSAPLLVSAAYSVSFMRQAAVPAIAEVLDRGGRGAIVTNARARNDRTIALFGRLYASGWSSREGREVLEHLRRVHARLPTGNDEMLYTLATVMFEPLRLDAFVGARAFTRNEQHALFRFWQDAGALMGVRDIPPDEHALTAWMLAYERQEYRYTEAGRRIADAVMEDFAARWFSSVAHFGARQLLIALADRRLARTHRLSTAVPGLSLATRVGMRSFLRLHGALPDGHVREWDWVA